MSESNAPEHVQGPTPPRRTAGRIAGSIALIVVALVLLIGGIQAIVDPAEVVANSSSTARSPDTEAEAQFSGLLLCFFGVTVLGFGILLFKKKPSSGTPSSSET
ncbi:drug/metabolite transporter (DMT)-like permease [Nocardia transvalensis]|uniref:Drug/metabolite transporter (DMT)-like permease n=1 Tax=Nocardia transvalensis TaxID=37333 RepID=A0A7W9PKD8_9NOCA|nr:hypothetical protein [Nocardia transvalensis]MBB5917323.1 drug/metabolite transporter (DMT)-like permease [Nocardia transvalensis]